MTSLVGVYSVFEVGMAGEPTAKMVGYLYYTGPDQDIVNNTPARLLHANRPYSATVPNIVKFGHWCLVDFSVTEFPVIMMFHDLTGRGHWETVYLRKISCEPREPDRKNVRRVEL